MPLPSSIWVKFTSEDAVLVTYLGVEYRLTWQADLVVWAYYLTGNSASGTIILLDVWSDQLTGTTGADVYNSSNVSAGAIVGYGDVVGTVLWTDWVVTGIVDPVGLTAATIVHRDNRLPLFVELPGNAFDLEGVYYRSAGDVQAPSEGSWSVELDMLGNDVGVGLSINTNIGGLNNLYSIAWNSSTNTGTTDCPFVEFIGELSTTEVFTANGTWTPPANIDTTKPVIVQAWGSGADGVDDGGWGGGGGSFAGTDIADFATFPVSITVDSAFGGSTTFVQTISPSVLHAQAESGGFNAQNEGGQAANNVGDVKFSGGNGGQGSNPNTSGGSAANSFSNGVNGTNGSTLSGGDGGTGGAAVDSSPGQAGTTPGGGGGAGGDGAAGGAGARGEVRIHYRLQLATGGGVGGYRLGAGSGVMLRNGMSVGAVGVTFKN